MSYPALLYWILNAAINKRLRAVASGRIFDEALRADLNQESVAIHRDIESVGL